MNEKIIITDFDGTVTKTDTIGAFLEKYADKKWRDIEEQWRAGKIGSGECMQRQFDLVKGLSEEELLRFIDSIEIDDYFKRLCELAKEKNIDVVIVSDGFDLFINSVLAKNNISGIKVYSNHLEFCDGRFYMSFPNKSDKCTKKSGTCKCRVVKSYKNVYKEVFYVGDSVSDFCVCDKADFLFAKHILSDYCKKQTLDFLEYNTFYEVIKNDRLGLNV